jgi:hypothetical protein
VRQLTVMVRSKPTEDTNEAFKKKFEENGIIMTTAKVREKLYDYIRIAADKKVKAILNAAGRRYNSRK